MTFKKAWETIDAIDSKELEKISAKFGEIKVIIPVPVNSTTKTGHDYIQRALKGGDIKSFGLPHSNLDFGIAIAFNHGWHPYEQVQISLK